MLYSAEHPRLDEMLLVTLVLEVGIYLPSVMYFEADD